MQENWKCIFKKQTGNYGAIRGIVLNMIQLTELYREMGDVKVPPRRSQENTKT